MPDAAFWDSRYAGDAYAYGEAPNAFLASLTFAPGQRALVPGDGEGRNGVFLAQQGLRVETLDLSPLGVLKARALAARHGVALEAQVADALTWPWPVASYDVIALLYLHLPPPQRQRLHASALKALKPGGRIVLEAFSPAHLAKQRVGARGGPRDAELLYSAAALREDFAQRSLLLIEDVETDLSEGALHHGRSAVVRLIVSAS